MSQHQPATAGTRQQRLARIAELVLERGSMPVADLAEELQVSRMTVYRDVSELASTGVIELQRGLVMAGLSSFTETSNAFRRTRHREDKAAACLEAIRFVRPGATVMLDDSSTVLELVPLLADLGPLTVVTHSQAVAQAVIRLPQLRLFLAGGTYRPAFEAYSGEATLRTLRDLSADVCFMSVTAVSAGVAYHPLEENVAVKRLMMAQSRRRVLLVDAAKFGHRATHRVAGLEEFDAVVIGGDPPRSELAPLRALDVDIRRA